MSELIKAVCQQKCYEKDGEGVTKIRYPGDLALFESDNVSPHFKAIEGGEYKLDFRTASEAELMEIKWRVSEAKAAMEEHFNTELNVSTDDSKQHIVTKILDIRFRSTQ